MPAYCQKSLSYPCALPPGSSGFLESHKIYHLPLAREFPKELPVLPKARLLDCGATSRDLSYRSQHRVGLRMDLATGLRTCC